MNPVSVRQIQEFLQDERDSAALYDVLAASEQNVALATVYRKLAATERRHADHWIGRLAAVNIAAPAHRISWRTRILIWMARRLGAKSVVSMVADQEIADARRYADMPDALAGMDADERGHARSLRTIAGDARGEGPFIARLEGRHRSTAGNALRAAVLGANDGLVSNFSLVMGVAGAGLPASAIAVTGVAGLIAGAGSMALGEWLSVQSSRELYEKQIDIERTEIEANPAEEADELALIYEAKGLPQAEARKLADRLIADSGSALDTLAREELGIDPNELGGSAIQAALTSFGLFAVGALIPVAPFFFRETEGAMLLSFAMSAVGLFVIGAAITILTGRGLIWSGMRQVLIGLAAAGLTYGVGRLVGVSIS